MKFRVWDKKFKRFIEGGELIFKLYGEEDFEISVNELGFDSGEGRQNDFEISQFIGLKDINGKDIYVGDIVELKDDVSSTYEIIFCNEKASFMLKNENRLNNITNNLKIVGNIFETKETK